MNYLSNKERLNLIKQSHPLNSIILVGSKGVTTSLIEETLNALYNHELIKVKVKADTKDERIAIANDIAKQTEAEMLKVIGHQAILYKKSDKPKK